MNSYKIIKDEGEFRKFIEWLPDLRENEVFYGCLQVRRKYFQELRSRDTIPLARFKATKETLYRKIRSLEIPYGAYQLKDGQPIPNEALVVYLTTNPRCEAKAFYALLKDLAVKAEQARTNKEFKFDATSFAKTALHNSKSRSVHVHFDVDFPEDGVDDSQSAPMSIEKIAQILDTTVGMQAVTLIRTRGGYHILIDPKLAKSSNWFLEVRKHIPTDQSGDVMLPIPGCVQGDFVPHIITHQLCQS